MELNSPYPPRWCDRPRNKKSASEPQPKPEKPRKPTQQANRAKQEAARRHARKRTLGILYTVLTVEIVMAVFTSPVFAVKQVTVSGLEGLTAIERAAIEKSVALAPQTNFLTVGTSKLQKQLSAQMEIKRAEVTRKLPNIIAVTVTPRTPFACVSLQKGTTEFQHYEVDAQGVPIRMTAQPTPRLPHLVSGQNVMPIAGKPLNDLALTQTLALLKNADSGLISRIEKIVIDPQGNLCLNMSDGVAIQFGQAENLGAKWDTVQKIYSRDPAIAQRMTGINLSVPEKPVCILREINLAENETVPSI